AVKREFRRPYGSEIKREVNLATKEIRCYNCNEIGHISRECGKREFGLPEQSQWNNREKRQEIVGSKQWNNREKRQEIVGSKQWNNRGKRYESSTRDRTWDSGFKEKSKDTKPTSMETACCEIELGKRKYET
ncbi:hypothetical protein L9F63_002336, partial [Diploptera punctata]